MTPRWWTYRIVHDDSPPGGWADAMGDAQASVVINAWLSMGYRFASVESAGRDLEIVLELHDAGLRLEIVGSPKT